MPTLSFYGTLLKSCDTPAYLSPMDTEAVVVRRAKLSDSRHLADIHQEAWLHAYRGLLPGLDLARAVSRRNINWWHAALRKNAGILVMEVQGKLAGYATFGPARLSNPSYRGEIYEFYILPPYQGLGFGRQFFQATLSELHRHGFAGVATRVLRDNDPAIRFYKAVGGRKIGEARDRFGTNTVSILTFGWRPRH